MKQKIANNYHVAGNDYVAIAISLTDDSDAHYFIGPDDSDPQWVCGAYDKAIAWTSPGI